MTTCNNNGVKIKKGGDKMGIIKDMLLLSSKGGDRRNKKD